MSEKSLNLLLVEDHLALREVLAESLVDFGYQVRAFESAEDALVDELAESCHIAILDVNLPGEDGLYLANQLRLRNPKIGIIFLTVQNQVADRLSGYEAGADLYLPKPISPDELHAAIKALSRRLPIDANIDVFFNLFSSELSNVQNDSVILSDEESRLLIALSQAAKQQLEFWELAESLGLDVENINLRTTLEKRISRLRKKLTQINQSSTSIKSIRGVGYQLTLSIKLQ